MCLKLPQFDGHQQLESEETSILWQEYAAICEVLRTDHRIGSIRLFDLSGRERI